MQRKTPESESIHFYPIRKKRPAYTNHIPNPSPPLHAHTSPTSLQPLIDCLLAFPGLFFPPPPAAPLNDRPVPLDAEPARGRPSWLRRPTWHASSLPPKPYFSFFFWRLWLVGPDEESPGRPLPADLGPERSSLSIATSKRSEVSWVSFGCPCLGVLWHCQLHILFLSLPTQDLNRDGADREEK